jgi:hypothetical protein
MCCFSRKVDHVADTNIFARASKDGRQFLVYSMHFEAADDLSMILPIPVPEHPKEDAVNFINLEKYPDFFSELRNGFPAPKSDFFRAPKNGAKAAPAMSFCIARRLHLKRLRRSIVSDLLHFPHLYGSLSER